MNMRSVSSTQSTSILSTCAPCMCRAALQLACDAPLESIVSRHANQLCFKPAALLLTKEQNWSSLLSEMTGHQDLVRCVACNGNMILSGSGDETIRYVVEAQQRQHDPVRHRR
eukprot:1157725-Pelagomonas_calceolata.AAC.2